MGTTEFDGVKGFLPQEEALQLLEWASQGALIGPLLEIGSYCGLSTLWLAKAARAAKTVVFAKFASAPQRPIALQLNF